MNSKIFVTESVTPDAGDYENRITEILNSRVFTNNGQQCRLLEKELARFLNAGYLALCANGTLGLELAIHAAGMTGKKVITTPFTYVATVSALLWKGCQVVLADIDEKTLCIDPKRIMDHLDDDVSGIVPVNVYGHPCDEEGIAEAARQAGGIPVIYDAAQAFGASLNGRQLLDAGRFAVCSFHATKVFHTFEGGLVVCHDRDDLENLRLLRAFGHRGDNHICLGINAKMSEAHAAMGLSLLDDFDKRREARKKASELYDALLCGKDTRYPEVPAGFHSNYGYYPVIFATEAILLKVMEALVQIDVFPRRYFYPALSRLPYLPGQSCPVAESIAPRVLCLPLFSTIKAETIEKVAKTVNGVLARA